MAADYKQRKLDLYAEQAEALSIVRERCKVRIADETGEALSQIAQVLINVIQAEEELLKRREDVDQ